MANASRDLRKPSKPGAVGATAPRPGLGFAGIKIVFNTRKVLAIAVIVTTVGPPSLLWASGPQSAGGATVEVVALKQFDDAVADYMALRRKLRTEVSGPVTNSSSSQITDASDALAGSIQRARRDARVSSIFNEPVAMVIKRRIADTVRTENLVSVLADIDDDENAGPSPKVHLRLPVSEQMATMPPALLKVLPPLPKELEYRIIGHYLVLRDVDASLILDYIPVAVPR